MRRAAGFIDRWQGLALLLLAPAFLFPTPARARLLLLLPVVWLASLLAGRPPLPRTPLNATLLLFSFMLLISVWATPDLAFSLPKIAGLLLGLAAYFAIVRLVRRPAALWRALALFILAGAGVALLGLLGIDWLNKVPLLATISQHLPAVIRGLPGAEEGFSANGVAGALIFIIPLQVALLAGALRRWRRLPGAGVLAGRPRLWLAAQGLLLVLAGGLVLLSESRGAWLGLAIGLVLMLFIHERRARWPLLAAGVAGLIGLLALGGPAAAIGLAGRVVGNDIGAKVIQRQELWYYGLLAIQSFPFTGMGLNAFRHALPLLYPTVPLPAGFDITHVHNHLLQAAINFGLPGLVAYLGLWLGAGYALWSVYRRSADPWLRAAALGLAAGLAAEFIYGTTDVIDFGAKLGLFFWFSLALSISLYQVSNPSNPSH